MKPLHLPLPPYNTKSIYFTNKIQINRHKFQSPAIKPIFKIELSQLPHKNYKDIPRNSTPTNKSSTNTN